MVKVRDFAILAAVLLLFFGAGFAVGWKSHRNGQISQDKPKVDTLYQRDTIVAETVKETQIPRGYELVASDVLRTYQNLVDLYRDSLSRVPVLVEVHDTSYIAVPLSDFTFTDGKTYTAVVNGYNCKMLHHEAYHETLIVQQPQLYNPKWQISPVVGAVAGKDVLGVGAGLKLDAWQNRGSSRQVQAYGFIYANGMPATVSTAVSLSPITSSENDEQDTRVQSADLSPAGMGGSWCAYCRTSRPVRR